MQNFKTSRFEFTPQCVPSAEIDSPYAVSSRNSSLSKSSDRVYPRRDELFQDENGNLYLYKVINGVHKYVKISADVASGSDNGTVTNSDVFLPYERLAKIEKQGLNSAIFEDGIIAVADGNKLKFYKQIEVTKELEHISNSDITLGADQEDYFQHKFGAFTYKNGETSFRVLIGYKFTPVGGSGSNFGIVTLQAFKLNSNLNSASTIYTIENFGNTFSWGNGQVLCQQVDVFKDTDNDIRIYAVNAIFKATVSLTGITYDPDHITQDASNFYSAGVVSGNTNAMLVTGYMNPAMKLYMQGVDGSLSIPRGGNKPSNYIAILNVKRHKAQPSTTGSYGIVSISNDSNDETSYVYTTDFSSSSVVETVFDFSLEENETFIRVLDNSQILNHSNIQDGYEKIVMSFVVITKKNGIYNAYLYYVAPNKVEIASGGSNLNEPYEDSTYSVIKAGKYQFNGSEEIAKMETSSYIYLLDNGNILENRSTGIVLYAASQFRYLSASFADSLFAANLQAINVTAKFADIDYINNKKIASEESFTKTFESKNAIAVSLLNNKTAAQPKDSTDRITLDAYAIPGISGNIKYNLCKTSAHTTFVFNEFIVSISMYSSKIYIFDIETNREYERSFAFSDSRVTPMIITFTHNNGNFVVNASKYGHLYGTATLQDQSFVFYTDKTLNEIIERDDSIEFITNEDNTTIDEYDYASQLQDRKFYTRTGNSIINVYGRISNSILAYVKETCIEIDSHTVDISKKDDIYQSPDTLIKSELRIKTYWKSVKISATLLNIDIVSGNAPGLVSNDYLFIPFNITFNTDYTATSIIRIFRPSIAYDESSINEKVVLDIDYFKNSPIRVVQSGFRYAPLNTIYNDNYTIPCIALSDDLVRYIDENQNIVNVFFKSILDGDNVNIAYKELAQERKDSINTEYFSNVEYIVCGNRLYEYASYKGLRLIIREVNSNENDLVPLFKVSEADYPSEDIVAYVTPKYIIYTQKSSTDSTISLQRINHTFNTGDFHSLSASHADIASIDSGDIHTVKLKTDHILLDNLHMEAKASLISEEDLSIGLRQSFIDGAKKYIAQSTKGKISHLGYLDDATNLVYRDNIHRTNNKFYPIFINRDKGNYLYARARVTDSNSINLEIWFTRGGDTIVDDDPKAYPNDAYAEPLLSIELKPLDYSEQISESFFNSISNSDYSYTSDSILSNYHDCIYYTRHVSITNTACMLTHDATTGESYIDAMTPDGKSIKLFSIKIGARKDITGNIFIYFNSCKTFNESIDKLETIFETFNNKPVVIQATNSEWWVWSNTDSPSNYMPIASVMSANDFSHNYCELTTNINYIRSQCIDDRKIIYFPALIHTQANNYTAINAIMMIGIYDKANNGISWSHINLNTDNNNNITDGTTSNPVGEYSSDDILLDNIPYIVDTRLDTSTYLTGNNELKTVFKFTIATNVVEGADISDDDNIVYTPDDKCYGLFKSSVQISRGGVYRNLQYQHTVLSGVIYNPDDESFTLTRGSLNISPQAVLLPIHDEHKELYSSAKLLKYFGGVFVTNRLGPNPELENNLIDSNYEKYNNMFKPTFYVGFNGDYYTETGEWNTSYSINPIFYSDNKFRSDSSCALYDWNNTELLLSNRLKETFSDTQAYNILTRTHESQYNSNNILDLSAKFGYVKDANGLDSRVRLTVTNSFIIRNDKNVFLYSPLPKDFTEYPDEYNSSTKKEYSKLFFSMRMLEVNDTTTDQIFSTACIFKKGISPVTSLPITAGGANGEWLNYELHYGNHDIYNEYSANDARQQIFAKYNLSYTKRGNEYGISNSYRPIYQHYYFGNLSTVTNIATENGSMTFAPMESYGANGALYLSFIPEFHGNTEAREYNIPGTEIYPTYNNYAELPYHNTIKYITENQKNGKSLVYVITSSTVYAYDTTANKWEDYISKLDIGDLEILSNNYISVYESGGMPESLPEFYEGSDHIAKYGKIEICNTEDSYPSRSASIYLDLNLYLNGRQVVIKK